MLEALVFAVWISVAAALQVSEGIGAMERIALGSSPIVTVLLIACIAVIAVLVIVLREQRYLADRLSASMDKLSVAEAEMAKEIRLLREGIHFAVSKGGGQ